MAPNRRQQLAGSNPLERRPNADNKPTLDQLTNTLLPEQMQAIVPADSEAFQIGHFTLTRIGIYGSGQVTDDEWKQVGGLIGNAGAALRWWIADWLNLSPGNWGQTYVEAEKVTGFSEQTLKNLAYVGRSVQLYSRKYELTFKHHVLVAALIPEEQRKWLDLAIKEKLSAAKLSQRMLDKDEEQEKIDEPPDVVNQTHWRTMKRLWRSVKTLDASKISLDDIKGVREWLDEVERGKRSADEGE